jgi:hypothetical protein
MAGIGTYIDIVNPYKFQETIEREAKIDNPRGVHINALILAFMGVLSTFAIAYMRNARIGIYSLASTTSPLSTFNQVGTPLGIIITFLVALFGAYLYPFLFNKIAKLLGGNGSFWRVAWPYSTITVALDIALIPIMIAYMTSIVVMCIMSIPMIIFPVYTSYLYYKVIRATHTSLSRNRAIATVIGTIILGTVIVMGITFGRTFIGI